MDVENQLRLLLRRAVDCEDVDVIQLRHCLLSTTSNDRFMCLISVVNENGITALHHAANNGDVSTLQSMLVHLNGEQRFVLLKMQDRTGATTLHRAVISQSIEIVKSLFAQLNRDQIENLLKIRDQEGGTTLHWAVYANSAVFKLVLDSVSSSPAYDLLSMQRDDGWTALHSAVFGGKTEIIQHLLAAITEDSLRFQLLMTSCHLKNTAVHYAAFKGHTEALRCLLALNTPATRNILLQLPNHSGNNSIHIASTLGHTDIVRFALKAISTAEERWDLLKHQNRSGNTALHFASRHGHIDVIHSILDYLPPIYQKELLSMKNVDGLTPIELATENNQTESVACQHIYRASHEENAFSREIHDARRRLHYSGGEKYGTEVAQTLQELDETQYENALLQDRIATLEVLVEDQSTEVQLCQSVTSLRCEVEKLIQQNLQFEKAAKEFEALITENGSTAQTSAQDLGDVKKPAEVFVGITECNKSARRKKDNGIDQPTETEDLLSEDGENI